LILWVFSLVSFVATIVSTIITTVVSSIVSSVVTAIVTPRSWLILIILHTIVCKQIRERVLSREFLRRQLAPALWTLIVNFKPLHAAVLMIKVFTRQL
jgi:hypothetical protein